MQESQLITTSETAAVIEETSGRSCGQEYVRRLARDGKLAVALIVGRGQRLFDRAAVIRLAEQRSQRRADGEPCGVATLPGPG